MIATYSKGEHKPIAEEEVSISFLNQYLPLIRKTENERTVKDLERILR